MLIAVFVWSVGDLFGGALALICLLAALVGLVWSFVLLPVWYHCLRPVWFWLLRVFGGGG